MTKVLISMGLRLTTQSSEARSVVFASAGGKMAFDSATKFSRSMSSFHRLPASPVSPTHSTDRPGKWESDIKGIFLHKSWVKMSLNSISGIEEDPNPIESALILATWIQFSDPGS